MIQLRLNPIVLPSFTSIVVSLLFTIFILLISVWEMLQKIPYLVQAFTIIENQITSIIVKNSSVDQLLSIVINSSFLNKTFYLLMWMLAGVLTYFILAIILIGRGQMKDLIYATNSNQKKKSALVNEFFVRASFRFFILILWIMYAVITVQLLLPVAISAVQVGSQSMGFFPISIFIILVTFHIHVVLFRLFLIKYRVFGQADEIILFQKH